VFISGHLVCFSLVQLQFLKIVCCRMSNCFCDRHGECLRKTPLFSTLIFIRGHSLSFFSSTPISFQRGYIKITMEVEPVEIVYKGKISNDDLGKYEYPKPSLYSLGDIQRIEYSNVRVHGHYYFKVTVVGEHAQTSGLVSGKTIPALEREFRRTVHKIIRIFDNLVTDIPNSRPENVSIKHSPFSHGCIVKTRGTDGTRAYLSCAEYSDALTLCDLIAEKWFPAKTTRTINSIVSASYPRNEYLVRMAFVKRYGWSIPSAFMLYQLNAFLTGKKTLEIGAGKCTHAKLLRAMGREIITTDPQDPNFHDPSDNLSNVVDHVQDAVSAVKVFNHVSGVDTLMMIWPPYTSTESDAFFEALKLFKGRYLVYIGEAIGGCTGSMGMSDYIENNYNTTEIALHTFYGIHDSMLLCTRKQRRSYKDALIQK